MKDNLVQWWAGRSQRERALLLVMLAIAAPLLLWLLYLMPIDRAIESARTEHWAATQRLIQVRSDTASLKGASSVAREAAQVIAQRSAAAAGFVPTRLEPTSDGKVSLTLGSAKPAALARWVRALDAEGLFVESINLRPNADGTVAVDAVFTPRRG